MMKLIARIVLLMTVTLAGCETMEGIGKDLQNLGDTIEKKAKE